MAEPCCDRAGAASRADRRWRILQGDRRGRTASRLHGRVDLFKPADRAGWPVPSYLDELLTDRAEYDGVALAVGGVSRAAIQARAEIIAWLERHALPCPPLVSPHAIVSQGVALGVGAFVAHGVIVNVDAQLGRFCVVNTGAIIGHDATIGDNSTISPAAFIGGRCSIGADSLVGPLAKVLQGLKVGDRTIIGMGCTVLRAVRPTQRSGRG